MGSCFTIEHCSRDLNNLWVVLLLRSSASDKSERRSTPFDKLFKIRADLWMERTIFELGIWICSTLQNFFITIWHFTHKTSFVKKKMKPLKTFPMAAERKIAWVVRIHVYGGLTMNCPILSRWDSLLSESQHLCLFVWCYFFIWISEKIFITARRESKMDGWADRLFGNSMTVNRLLSYRLPSFRCVPG